MEVDIPHSQSSTVLEYPPQSGTSSSEGLWDDLSDDALLQMIEQSSTDDGCHNNLVDQALSKDRKMLKLKVEETEIKITKQKSHGSDKKEISLHQFVNVFNNPKDSIYSGNGSLKSTSETNLKCDSETGKGGLTSDLISNHKIDDASGNKSSSLKYLASEVKLDEGNLKRAVCESNPGTSKNECVNKSEMSRPSKEITVTESPPAKKNRVFTPFQLFRGKYLNVTDLTSQAWCEQELVYTFTRIPTVEVDSSGLKAGSSIHLARELEVHDIKTVSVTSREDSFGIKLLNMLTSITALSSGLSDIIRELPVFGELPNSSMFVSGIIDEIGYNKQGELELVELKTRKMQRAPSKAQHKTHSLQVMIYKYLFDALVKGSLSRDTILTHLSLDPDKPLGKAVLDHGKTRGLECSLFGELLDVVLLRFQFSDLPLIDSLKLEYCYQATCASFASKHVEMNADWLDKTLKHYLKFWNGEREPEGVDVEEAWKCGFCAYYDGCEWVEKKTKQLTLTNKLNNSL
ncbi:exonuclease V-like isoform X2 [Antedon mediterranea]|uniref:exonuclease V-like isoform X2 n=1 Tax=Antedon mediterranea TaxID=105859 RepID=UPI003AF6F9A0